MCLQEVSLQQQQQQQGGLDQFPRHSQEVSRQQRQQEFLQANVVAEGCSSGSSSRLVQALLPAETLQQGQQQEFLQAFLLAEKLQQMQQREFLQALLQAQLLQQLCGLPVDFVLTGCGCLAVAVLSAASVSMDGNCSQLRPRGCSMLMVLHHDKTEGNEV